MRPNPFATCAAASAAVIATPPVASPAETTASTNVVIGVITAEPSGARSSPVNDLPVDTSLPPVTMIDPVPNKPLKVPCSPAPVFVRTVVKGSLDSDTVDPTR